MKINYVYFGRSDDALHQGQRAAGFAANHELKTARMEIFSSPVWGGGGWGGLYSVLVRKHAASKQLLLLYTRWE